VLPHAPDQDFTHVIGDGYVIVRYRPDLGVSDEWFAELGQQEAPP
jgi:hypothetical protein